MEAASETLRLRILEERTCKEEGAEDENELLKELERRRPDKKREEREKDIEANSPESKAFGKGKGKVVRYDNEPNEVFDQRSD